MADVLVCVKRVPDDSGEVVLTEAGDPLKEDDNLGFLPVLALYLHKLTGGLIFPTQTNTGLLFVTKDNVKPYLDTKTRFEGSSTEQQVVERSGAIAMPGSMANAAGTCAPQVGALQLQGVARCCQRIACC